MFSSSIKTMCSREKKTVGKMKKTGFDIDKEGAAECHLVRLLGELHVQTGIGNAAQGEQKYLTSK